MDAHRTVSSGESLPPSNADIAARLDTIAELLEAQEANPYRVRAYRMAAQTLRDLKKPAHEILQTALYSNTAHAHELGMTKDWVVIYRDDRDGAGQWTVVTARYGSLRGKRIVRGREAECDAFYSSPASSS